MEFDELSNRVIGCAIEVHRVLGPGLLESAYRGCLVHELRLRGIKVDAELVLPVVYKGATIECGYRMDLLVEDQVIVEVKSVAALDPIHEAQLLSYLKLAKKKVGLLINFNVQQLIKGVRRRVL